MSFEAPNLDDRKFQDIVDELKLRIPLYCPEWTDHNVSDPGVTLIELFAYMAEQLLFRMNQIPNLHYMKFAQFLGIPIPTPQPARADVIFWLTKALTGNATGLKIPKGTEVSTTQTETISPIVFTTEEEVTIFAPQLGGVLQDMRGSRPVYVDRNILSGEAGHVTLFSEPPQRDDDFYFEFDNDLSHHILRLRLRFRDRVGTNINVANPPIIWQAYTDKHEWAPLSVLRDTTKGLNAPGEIELQLPRLTKFTRRWSDVPTNATTANAGARYSVRIRVTRREYDKSPELLQIDEIAALGRSVTAVHTQVVEQEFLGESDGSPGQRFRLSQSPIVLPLQAGETLWVGELPEPDLSQLEQDWHYVENFTYPDETILGNGKGAKQTIEPPYHFTIDVTTNEARFAPAIRLSNGEIKQYGQVPELGEPIYFLRYRFAGSLANVPAQAINVLKTSIPYVARVENQRPAIGGQDTPSLDAMEMEVQRYLRHHQRQQGQKAVTADDYIMLVKAQFLEQVAKVECHPSPTEPNTMHVFVVAPLPIETLNTSNLAQTDLDVPDLYIEQIQRYLHDFRLLTVHIHVQNPTYVRINVRIQLSGVENNEIQEQIRNRLDYYLHPIYGNTIGQGWPMAPEIDSHRLHSWLDTNIEAIDIRQIQLLPEGLVQQTGSAGTQVQWLEKITTLAWDQLIIPGRYYIEFE